VTLILRSGGPAGCYWEIGQNRPI